MVGIVVTSRVVLGVVELREMETRRRVCWPKELEGRCRRSWLVGLCVVGL